MSTQAETAAKSAQAENEKTALLVAGKAQTEWTSYEIDSDLLTPADAWRVRLTLSPSASGDYRLPDGVVKGAVAQVRIGGDLVMTGRIDALRVRVAKREANLEIAGRDNAAVLLDCSAPLTGGRKLGLAQIVAKVVRPLGVTKIRIDAAAGVATTRDKVAVEPGDTAWDALTHAAEADGLWPWMDPDGTLVVGGPDYSDAANPPVAELRLVTTTAGKPAVRGTNVESLERLDNAAEEYGTVTVLGQTPGSESAGGKHGLKSSATDAAFAAVWPRRKIVTVYSADSVAACRARAQKLLADSRLKSFELRALVRGHRIAAPGWPGDGKLWTPGQRVRVVAPRLGCVGTYFLMARTFVLSEGGGTMTRLSLREDKVWILTARPHAGGRKKKSKYAAEISDEGDVE